MLDSLTDSSSSELSSSTRSSRRFPVTIVVVRFLFIFMAFATSVALFRNRSSTLLSRSPLSSSPPRFMSPNSTKSSINNFICKPLDLLRARMFSSSSATPSSTEGGKLPAEKDPSTVSDDEWRKVLSREEYRVLRGKGTEYPGTGEYDSFYPNEGHFVCRACANPLYSAKSKFKSGCGWPAFDKCYKDAIETKIDLSFGSRRVEILCKKCGGHLGHVFEGERLTNTNERHCVNSISVKYVPGENSSEEGKLM